MSRAEASFESKPMPHLAVPVKRLVCARLRLRSACVTCCILRAVETENLVLTGRHVCLEPLDHRHIEGLAAAAAADPSLYYLAWRDAGTAMPFAIVRVDDRVVIGSTRFWNLERWPWPQGRSRHGRPVPDARGLRPILPAATTRIDGRAGWQSPVAASFDQSLCPISQCPSAAGRR